VANVVNTGPTNSAPASEEEPRGAGIDILSPEEQEEEPEPAQPEAAQPLTDQPVAATAARPVEGDRARVRDLSMDARMRFWRMRALIMLVVGVVFSIIVSWQVGLTLAVLAGIADAVYRSRIVASIPAGAKLDRAQRRTQRQLARMQRAGYLALHARPIPDSPEVIDHLVVGPTGVYAIDSEKWRKDLPIRTRNGKQLWHGPDSKKARLEHARWEAGQASQRLGTAMGREVQVQPAMAVYGPKVPWDIARIREVDVFNGDRLKKYLRRRARMKDRPQLSAEEIREIHDAAGAVLPLAPTRTPAPVG
jgi:hypothetical protein